MPLLAPLNWTQTHVSDAGLNELQLPLRRYHLS